MRCIQHKIMENRLTIVQYMRHMSSMFSVITLLFQFNILNTYEWAISQTQSRKLYRIYYFCSQQPTPIFVHNTHQTHNPIERKYFPSALYLVVPCTMCTAYKTTPTIAKLIGNL